MNWLKRIFRSRRDYSEEDFSLRLVPVFREGVRVEYRRGNISHNLIAEYVGRRWGALDIRVSSDLPPEQLGDLVRDLECGLQAMGREYVIAQAETPVEIPHDEQERAAAALRQMGFEPEA